jgi:hypothetical protein
MSCSSLSQLFPLDAIGAGLRAAALAVEAE